jgi:sortase A
MKPSHDYAAVHFKRTGFPREKTAAVYIGRDCLGHPYTESLLTFLGKVGDNVYVTDANGTKYTYRVFETFVGSSSNLSVTRPGKNILTLQTHTLADYKRRLIGWAEPVSRRGTNEERRPG